MKEYEQSQFELWLISGIICLALFIYSIDFSYRYSPWVYLSFCLMAAYIARKESFVLTSIAVRLLASLVIVSMALQATIQPDDAVPSSRLQRAFAARSWGAIVMLQFGFPVIHFAIWVADGKRLATHFRKRFLG